MNPIISAMTSEILSNIGQAFRVVLREELDPLVRAVRQVELSLDRFDTRLSALEGKR